MRNKYKLTSVNADVSGIKIHISYFCYENLYPGCQRLFMNSFLF